MNEIQFPATRTPVTTPSVTDRSQRSERARAARREEILDAARRVFASRGFRGTTIADIAEDAGIALGTIYLYFPSKEDVYAALRQRLMDLIAAASSPSGGPTTWEAAIRSRMANVFDVCGKNTDLVRLAVLNADPDSRVMARSRDDDRDRAEPLVRALAAGIERGQVRRMDAVIAARLINGVVMFAVYQAFVLADGADADRYRDACADMIVAYVAPPG